ncbi:uncharacterized protein LOC103398386 isoform X2 [Cynoglossus semilaevis]|uniref:uncharacterized protein LOC103398386 isoform X2 n=1 Tax=Cynoglossus semilaevis TaxID=244447 RepID=UPI000D62FA6F|nr:uncharacterized protein LOC103398386 isoform X2 [Cynoglossus semilaevis]
MSLTKCLSRLLVICVCLLASVVNCENSQKVIGKKRDNVRQTFKHHPVLNKPDEMRRFSAGVKKDPEGKAIPYFMKKIKHNRPNPVLSTGAGKFPKYSHHTRIRSSKGFSPIQVDQQRKRNGLYSHWKIHNANSRGISSPHSFRSNRTNPLPKALKSVKDSTVGGRSSGSRSSGTLVAWSPRFLNTEAMSETKGYAHVRHIKPGSEKLQHQASSHAGIKLMGHHGSQSVSGNHNHNPELGSGAQISSERHTNHNLGKPPSGSFNGRLPVKSQVPVQGKFKPFQRVDSHFDLSNHTQKFEETTALPSLNSTVGSSTTVSPVSQELDTNSTSPTQPFEPLISPEEPSSNSTEAGSLDQNKE